LTADRVGRMIKEKTEDETYDERKGGKNLRSRALDDHVPYDTQSAGRLRQSRVCSICGVSWHVDCGVWAVSDCGALCCAAGDCVSTVTRRMEAAAGSRAAWLTTFASANKIKESS